MFKKFIAWLKSFFPVAIFTISAKPTCSELLIEAWKKAQTLEFGDCVLIEFDHAGNGSMRVIAKDYLDNANGDIVIRTAHFPYCKTSKLSSQAMQAYQRKCQYPRNFEDAKRIAAVIPKNRSPNPYL